MITHLGNAYRCRISFGLDGPVEKESNAEKQKACLKKAGFSNLAPLTGLEPVTYGLTVRRSTD